MKLFWSFLNDGVINDIIAIMVDKEIIFLSIWYY